MDVSCLNFTIILFAPVIYVFFRGNKWNSFITVLRFSLPSNKEGDSVERRMNRKRFSREEGKKKSWQFFMLANEPDERKPSWTQFLAKNSSRKLLSGFFKLISLLERMLGHSFEFRGEFECYGKLSKWKQMSPNKNFVERTKISVE